MWWAALGDVRPEHAELLDPVERGRRERYLRPEDRDRFTLGVTMTRLAVGDLLGLAPERVPVTRACSDCGAPHGPPVVDGGPFLSVSHSGDRVALALSPDGPVGVDVEASGRSLEAAIAAQVLTAAETADLRRLGPDGFQRGLFAYWTRKEAVLKATGEGLRVSLTDVYVSAPEEPPRLLAWEGRPELTGRITMHGLHPGTGHTACLALIDQPQQSVRELPARELPGF